MSRYKVGDICCLTYNYTAWGIEYFKIAGILGDQYVIEYADGYLEKWTIPSLDDDKRVRICHEKMLCAEFNKE